MPVKYDNLKATVFIGISAQPRIGAHSQGTKI